METMLFYLLALCQAQAEALRSAKLELLLHEALLSDIDEMHADLDKGFDLLDLQYQEMDRIIEEGRH